MSDSLFSPSPYSSSQGAHNPSVRNERTAGGGGGHPRGGPSSASPEVERFTKQIAIMKNLRSEACRELRDFQNIFHERLDFGLFAFIYAQLLLRDQKDRERDALMERLEEKVNALQDGVAHSTAQELSDAAEETIRGVAKSVLIQPFRTHFDHKHEVKDLLKRRKEFLGLVKYYTRKEDIKKVESYAQSQCNYVRSILRDLLMQVRFGGEPLGHTETCYLIKRKMDIDTISSTLALWVLVLRDFMRKRHDQLAARLKSGGLEESHDQDNEGGQQDEGNIAGDEDREEDMDDGRPAKRRRYNPRPPRGDDFFGIMTTWLAEQVRKYGKPIGKSDKWESYFRELCSKERDEFKDDDLELIPSNYKPVTHTPRPEDSARAVEDTRQALEALQRANVRALLGHSTASNDSRIRNDPPSQRQPPLNAEFNPPDQSQVASASNRPYDARFAASTVGREFSGTPTSSSGDAQTMSGAINGMGGDPTRPAQSYYGSIDMNGIRPNRYPSRAPNSLSPYDGGRPSPRELSPTLRQDIGGHRARIQGPRPQMRTPFRPGSGTMLSPLPSMTRTQDPRTQNFFANDRTTSFSSHSPFSSPGVQSRAGGSHHTVMYHSRMTGAAGPPTTSRPPPRPSHDSYGTYLYGQQATTYTQQRPDAFNTTQGFGFNFGTQDAGTSQHGLTTSNFQPRS